MAIPLTPMIGAEKENKLKALNLYFESPISERHKLSKPIKLPPDIEGRKEYINKINKMSVDQLKNEMKQYGLKCASKLLMKQRLEMVWDALHPNSPMIRKLNQCIKQDKYDDGDSDINQDEQTQGINTLIVDNIFKILLS